MTPLGDYEKRIKQDGTVLYSGECAAGDGWVEEGEPYAIAYHDIERGGIFHHRCKPNGGGWYGVDGTVEHESPVYE